MATDWTDDQKKVMRWLALPDGWKQPESFAALCRTLNGGNGVNRTLAYYWMTMPGWKLAASKMALLTMLEIEPMLVKARLSNMLSPGGWQERVNYDRYVREKLNDMHAQHMFDEVLDQPSEDKLLTEERRRLAAERLSLMPPEQRMQFQELLVDLVGLSLSNLTVIENSSLDASTQGDEVTPASLPVEMWVNPAEEAAKEVQRAITQRREGAAKYDSTAKSVTPGGLQSLKKRTTRKKRGRYNKGKSNTQAE